MHRTPNSVFFSFHFFCGAGDKSVRFRRIHDYILYNGVQMCDKIDYAIILGTTAIIVALITQLSSLLLQLHDKKAQRKDHLRKKYEEMMFYFSESLFWLGEVNCCTSQEKISTILQSLHSRKALSLCLLYFPELSDKANDYVCAQASYYESVIIVFKEEAGVTAWQQADLRNKEKHKMASKELINKKTIFENLIIKNSKKYTRVTTCQLYFFKRLKAWVLSKFKT